MCSNSSNGYDIIHAKRGCVVVSVKGNIHAASATLGRLNLGVDSYTNVLIARRRSSRIGKLAAFLGGGPLPICNTSSALSFLSTGNVIPTDYTLHALSNKRRSIKSFNIAVFPADRSIPYINCHVRAPSGGAVAVTASLKILAPPMRRTLDNYSLITLRDGCSLRVLHDKQCPCCLHSHVRSGQNRLSGSRYSTGLLRLVRRKYGGFTLYRLSRRGGAPTLTLRAVFGALNTTNIIPRGSYVIRTRHHGRVDPTLAFWRGGGVALSVVTLRDVARETVFIIVPSPTKCQTEKPTPTTNQ